MGWTKVPASLRVVAEADLLPVLDLALAKSNVSTARLGGAQGHASIGSLLLCEDYVWASLGHATKAKQGKGNRLLAEHHELLQLRSAKAHSSITHYAPAGHAN